MPVVAPGPPPGAASSPPGLPLTGERTLPGPAHENYWFRRHLVVYRWWRSFVVGADVLEAGCGEGYGADALAGSARRVVGVELDAAAAAHAARTYPSVPVVRADLAALPVADASVDVVATSQVYEHLHDQAGFLAACHRVLRPGGTLLLSTPNRWTFSPGHRPGQPHLNPFHTREVDPRELVADLDGLFRVTRLRGVRHGRRLRRAERSRGPLVARLLAAGPDPTAWPPDLVDLVASVTAEDFVVDDADVGAALDLVVVAERRPEPGTPAGVAERRAGAGPRP